MKPPLKILITSDDNQIQFLKTIKTKTGVWYVYEYVVSKTKKGMEIYFDEKELRYQLNNFFKII